MALNFPDSPSTNDTYSAGGTTWIWDGTLWKVSALSTGYGAATGGTSSTITVNSESYTLLEFTSTGTLTVTKAGLFDVLVVGGGGGGGTDGSFIAGAGGAGGYREYTGVYLDANQTVTIGAGAAVNSYRGGHSRCGQTFAAGGGSKYLYTQPRNGASGAGGGYGGGAGAHGDGVTGNNGGTAFDVSGSGGGGGASAVGSNGTSGTGGAGGDGSDASSFRGESATTTYYAGGGGGQGTTTRGLGGDGGGGNGKDPSNASTAGATNTGGGGGANGSAGGSGIVLVRFKN